MSLGVIPSVSIGFLEKNRKEEKTSKTGSFATTKEPTPQGSPLPQQRLPRRDEAEGQKGHPTSSLQQSSALPQRSHCSQ